MRSAQERPTSNIFVAHLHSCPQYQQLFVASMHNAKPNQADCSASRAASSARNRKFASPAMPQLPSLVLLIRGELAQVDEAHQRHQQHLVVRARFLLEEPLEVVPIFEAQGATIPHHPGLGQCRHVLVADALDREIDRVARAWAQSANLATTCVRAHPLRSTGIEGLVCEIATMPRV